MDPDDGLLVVKTDTYLHGGDPSSTCVVRSTIVIGLRLREMAGARPSERGSDEGNHFFLPPSLVLPFTTHPSHRLSISLT